MNWEAIGAMSELIGATAVVVTLAYLAVQIRENSRAVRSSTRSDISRGQMDINFILAENPDLAVACYGLLKGEEITIRRALNTIPTCNFERTSYCNASRPAVMGQVQLSDFNSHIGLRSPALVRGFLCKI